MSNSKKITVMAFIMMILTSVFGVTNIGIGFYRMGYAAIPLFILGGIFFFIPFIMMMVEFGTGFKGRGDGIFFWMKESVSVKFAFYGIMMWYAAYVIWLFGKSFSIWVPLSFAIFGTDVTAGTITTGFQYLAGGSDAQAAYAGTDLMPLVLGLVGLGVVWGFSWVVMQGPSKLSKVASIGGIMVIILNFLLLGGGFLALVINGEFAHPINMHEFLTSPNPAFQTTMPYLGFVVFAVFAYGGTEALAGISDRLENPERDLKKAIFGAGAFIVFCYVVGFLMAGAGTNWSDFPEGTSSMSSLFLMMERLGHTITPNSDGLAEILKRFSGFGMFCTFLGAFITLAYAPLTQLVDGSPKEVWPDSFQETNEVGIKTGALKTQAIIVSILIIAKTVFALIDAETANEIYELIITMTNVAMTIPYLFLIWAWFKFRGNDNLEKGIILIKSKGMIVACTIVTMFMVTFGNVFTIIDPLVSGNMNIFIWTVMGPILFSLLAFALIKKSNIK
ncbi:MAG: glutamate/gamma-aminobutyrate family transporter YjeM [Mycoplasmatales bacterium]